MPRTDIENVDRTKRIVAYVKAFGGTVHNKSRGLPVVLYWDGDNWIETSDFCMVEVEDILYWEYCFELPDEKSDLQEKLSQIREATSDTQQQICMIQLLEMIVERLEELDARHNQV